MRLIKTLRLAVISALAAMAFVGAGTASADSPCEDNVYHETGTCVDPLANGRAILGLTTAGDSWTFLGGVFKVKCDSQMKGEVDSSRGSHAGLRVLISWLTFSSCSGACLGADGKGELYLLFFDALKLHALVTRHAEGDRPEVLLFGCPLGDCNYKITLPTLLEVVGDTLVAKEELLTRTDGLCPATIKGDGTYLMTLELDEDVPLYLAAYRS